MRGQERPSVFHPNLKEQQTEVLRKVPIVKNTDQLNDSVHVGDAGRWRP